MESSSLAIGLIQRIEAERLLLLLQWHEVDKLWRFIVAEQLQAESPREALRREIAWQLNLDRNRDFLVANMAQLVTEASEQPDGEGPIQILKLAFFPVHLYSRRAIQQISHNPSVRWFSSLEVLSGKPILGGQVDPRVSAWLQRWKIVQPWR
ncbi:MAG TPA: hypothetical protein PKD64_00545 [Pirellulaceae bacterium]|nr:hypothetical protein [Pirellulaceae bacterium]HMO90658.1 hypothetical protein [Pirellulaceae bacterium]HMP67763.1 hypothetical protein [Pirellulaceae bacterium]